MIQDMKYTLLTLLLTCAVVFGSMAGMTFILRMREQQLLSERGEVLVESPVRVWQKQEEDTGWTSEPYQLTAAQMEEVIGSWDERLAVTVHQPVNGQIPMETAIEAGKEWLSEMGFQITADEESARIYSVRATLSVTDQADPAGAQSEPYYSFWNLRFSNQTMMAFLRLNAVTGRVWNADITLYTDLAQEIFDEKSCEQELRRFVELSGLQIPDTYVINKKTDKVEAVIDIADSRLRAEAAYWHSQAKYVYVIEEETGLVDYQDRAPMAEETRILFQYTVDGAGREPAVP